MYADTIPEKILKHMKSVPHTVVKRQQIALIIYGEMWDKLSPAIINNYINVCMNNVKKLLAKNEKIETIRGVGYELKD